MNNAELLKKIKAGTATAEDLDSFADAICKRAVEETLRTIPQVVDHCTKQAIFLREKAHKFYKDNPDLVEERPLVQRAMHELEVENPGMNYDDLINNLAEKVKTVKRLKGEIEHTAKPDNGVL